VNSHLQKLIIARDTTFDDDIYIQATFCGTNLPGNAECQCHHPVLTDDGATAVI